MTETERQRTFKDYYKNNQGIFYKKFSTDINNIHYDYDIYWGEPEIIFDQYTLLHTFPLAVSIIPQFKNWPNSRIYLHEKLTQENKNIFEMIIAHEIGHFFLHDVVGVTRPSALNFMDENTAEIWADYFSYSFFLKYRNLQKIEGFYSIMEEACNLQYRIYNLNPEEHKELAYTQKVHKLQTLKDTIIKGMENNLSLYLQMEKAIEIMLMALGDIFEEKTLTESSHEVIIR